MFRISSIQSDNSGRHRTLLTISSTPAALSQISAARPVSSSSIVKSPIRKGILSNTLGRLRLDLKDRVTGLRRLLKCACQSFSLSILSSAVMIPLERLLRQVNLLIATQASLA